LAVWASDITKRVFNGEDINTFEDTNFKNRHIYNWDQLIKWKIDENNLPPNSIIQNRVYTFYELYQRYIYGGVLLLLVESILILILFANINRRKKAEETLRIAHVTLEQSQAQWRSLTETSPDHILTLDSNLNIEFANFAAFGLTVKELIGTPLYQYVEGDEKQNEVKVILESVLQTSKEKTYETVYDIQEGGTIYFESRVVPRKLEGSKDIIGLTVSSRNITKRKQAEEKVHRSKILLESSIESPKDMIILSLDRKYRYLYFNKTHAESMAHVYGKQVRIGDCIFDHMKSKDDIEKVKAHYDRAFVGEGHIAIEEYGEDQLRYYYEIRYNPIYDEKNEIIGVTSFAQNITERKEAEDQIKASLIEKETLLHEIHHRVKNNMPVISSLLKLQSNSIEDDRIKDALKESQNRIYTMSAVHETLHGSENLSEIDLKGYLSKVTSSIFQTYNVNPNNVKLNISIEEIPINIKQASPLGLVINEVVSNSLKYAFPDDRKGEINVEMKKLVNELELIIMDNGVGIPDELDWRNIDTLGLKLVRTLIENQLDGSIEMENNNGAKFTIKFNIDV
jgi:PAS domain S-box-containing protein